MIGGGLSRRRVIPCGLVPPVARLGARSATLRISGRVRRLFAPASILEGFHRHPAPDHEGVRDEAERGVVDLGAALPEEGVEALVDGFVFRRRLVGDHAPVDLETCAAADEPQSRAGFCLDLDVPALRTGLAPVEDGAKFAAAVAGREGETGGDRRVPVRRKLEIAPASRRSDRA